MTTETMDPLNTFTEEQIKVLEDIGLRPVGIFLPGNSAGLSWKKVYPDPEFLWSTTTEDIRQDRYSFNHAATMFGPTHIKDEETWKYYNLNALDTDCQVVHNRLVIPISQLLDASSWDWVTDRLRDLVKAFQSSVDVFNGDYNQSLLEILKASTFVTKTRKEYGHHIYWLSRQQRRAIGSVACKSGFEFEIKTDNSLGLCTLPGSAHKEDPKFRYTAVGITDSILVNDILYDLFVEMFKVCLTNGNLYNTTEQQQQAKYKGNTNKVQQQRQSPKQKNNHKGNNTNLIFLSAATVKSSAGYISPFIAKKYRNDFHIRFAGLLFHAGISEKSAAQVVAAICANTEDEEARQRQITLTVTYEKGFNGEEIEGAPKLAELIANKVSGQDLSSAKHLLDGLKLLWRMDKRGNRQFSNGDGDGDDKDGGGDDDYVTNEGQQQDNRHGWMPSYITDELMRYKWAFRRYNPVSLVIAKPEWNQLLESRLKSMQIAKDPNDHSDEKETKYYLSFRDIFMNAIPIEVTTYEDPINLTLDHRYKIKFRTSNNKVFTVGPASLDAIINDLSDRSLICARIGAKDALTSIINAFENDGSIIVSREIETPGFYLVDGRIRVFRMNAFRDYTQEELKQAGLFLSELVVKFRRREVPATTIKWGIMAPFDYVLKQHTEDFCWIPWMGLSGFPRSGKTTQGRIATGMWSEHYPRGMKYILPYTAVDTEARLAGRLNRCTLPILVNECDDLNEEKNSKMREMVKNSMESRISRAKFENKTTWIEEPALSAGILTSNPPFSSELGFRSRLIYIVYTKQDKYWDEAQKREFTAFFTKGRKLLSVLSNFASKYILNNQKVLLKENIEDCDWKVSAEDVLRAFYGAAGIQVPDWLSLWVDESDVAESAIQEASETARFEIRGFFEKAIIEAYRIDPLVETDSECRRMFQAADIDLRRKLNRCLTQRLITYLHSHTSRANTSEIVITHDVLREIKRYKIANIGTLQGLAREIPNFEYGQLKLGGKVARVVHGPYEDFVRFLDLGVEED